MLKTAATVEEEIREYVTKKTKKNRGAITSIEVKHNKDYFPKAEVPNVVVGGYVTFDSGEKIFVYRFENKVNNFANGKGYYTSSGYNSEKKVKEVLEGWNDLGELPLF
jgi:hypothetical protein